MRRDVSVGFHYSELLNVHQPSESVAMLTAVPPDESLASSRTRGDGSAASATTKMGQGTLTTLPLLALCFLIVSGGPSGTESIITGTLAPRLALSALVAAD